MKRLIYRLIGAVFLLLAAVPAAKSGEEHLAGLNDIYWYQGPAFLPGLNVASSLPQPIPLSAKRPLIAIVIDDMGVDQKRSARAVRHLPPAVTFSYLAYAPHIHEQVRTAQAKGHEIILHLPWEADNPKEDPGPHHLGVNMPVEQLQKNLLANLDGFEGYVGVNNHMGSRFSRDRAGLEVVMAELQRRGLLYLDSKTIADSIAEAVASEYGVPTTHRDVFLDHDENSKGVGSSLKEVESYARRHGSVIAIGHPKDVTLSKLEPWLATLEDKGFQLAPLSVVVKYRQTEGHIAHLEQKKE